jgi:hypothetical protein
MHVRWNGKCTESWRGEGETRQVRIAYQEQTDQKLNLTGSLESFHGERGKTAAQLTPYNTNTNGLMHAPTLSFPVRQRLLLAPVRQKKMTTISWWWTFHVGTKSNSEGKRPRFLVRSGLQVVHRDVKHFCDVDGTAFICFLLPKRWRAYISVEIADE